MNWLIINHDVVSHVLLCLIRAVSWNKTLPLSVYTPTTLWYSAPSLFLFTHLKRFSFIVHPHYRLSTLCTYRPHVVSSATTDQSFFCVLTSWMFTGFSFKPWSCSTITIHEAYHLPLHFLFIKKSIKDPFGWVLNLGVHVVFFIFYKTYHGGNKQSATWLNISTNDSQRFTSYRAVCIIMTQFICSHYVSNIVESST